MSTDLRGQRVLVTGAGGQLGSYLRRTLDHAGAEVVGVGSQARPGVNHLLDITDGKLVRETLAEVEPALVIHAAAFTDVDGAERNEAGARAVNVDGSRHVAEAAAVVGARLIGVGTDFVFAGDGGAPYAEDAPTDPHSVYGKTKLLGEQAILAVDPGFAVARTAWLYGGAGKHFPRTVLNVVQSRGAIEVVDDEFGSPTFAGDLAEALVQLAQYEFSGVYHLANEGRASRFELARAVMSAAGRDPNLVRPISTAEFLARFPLPARRPADSTLVSIRAKALGVVMPGWRDAVERYAPQLQFEFVSPIEGEKG